jgi:hypothetical protein
MAFYVMMLGAIVLGLGVGALIARAQAKARVRRIDAMVTRFGGRLQSDVCRHCGQTIYLRKDGQVNKRYHDPERCPRRVSFADAGGIENDKVEA